MKTRQRRYASWFASIASIRAAPGLRYDLIVASGVLYHLRDPLSFLERAAAATDALFLWTHYMSETAMPLSDIRRGAFRAVIERRSFHGIEVRQYPRSISSSGGECVVLRRAL